MSQFYDYFCDLPLESVTPAIPPPGWANGSATNYSTSEIRDISLSYGGDALGYGPRFWFHSSSSSGRMSKYHVAASLDQATSTFEVAILHNKVSTNYTNRERMGPCFWTATPITSGDGGENRGYVCTYNDTMAIRGRANVRDVWFVQTDAPGPITAVPAYDEYAWDVMTVTPEQIRYRRLNLDLSVGAELVVPLIIPITPVALGLFMHTGGAHAVIAAGIGTNGDPAPFSASSGEPPRRRSPLLLSPW